MRGRKEGQEQLFSYVGLETYVPDNHPLRRVRKLVDGMLSEMDEELELLYADVGRPSIPPERERMLVEQLQYNLLFKWFVGLQIEENVWNATTFTKNRDRLLNEQIARSFFSSTVKRAEKKRLLSDEHFTLDGSLIESFASLKSYRPKDKSDGDPENFHGKKRRTCGADKGYDTRRFAKIARTNRFTPHAAAKKSSGAIELRTTRHPGYLIGQRKRKRVEEIFGWGKTSVH